MKPSVIRLQQSLATTSKKSKPARTDLIKSEFSVFIDHIRAYPRYKAVRSHSVNVDHHLEWHCETPTPRRE
jgi:hypothetical protein